MLWPPGRRPYSHPSAPASAPAPAPVVSLGDSDFHKSRDFSCNRVACVTTLSDGLRGAPGTEARQADSGGWEIVPLEPIEPIEGKSSC